MPYRSPLADIEEEILLAGHEPGTPAYQRAFLTRKVELCQERQGVPACTACRAYDHCTTVKEYLIQVKYTPDGLQRAPSEPKTGVR